MGVQGLWHLLQPCARPTKLESLEGKRLAIDSSIWLYHFQMAMRDKEGRTLSNAHILGFLWRILKLIHFGIRPIFVFDGGAPVLKRKTLSGRRTRKSGARDDHRKVAERLLHARMREAAVAHVTGKAGQSTGNDADGEEASPAGHGLGDNTVYMEDLAGTTGASAAAENTVSGADDGAISAQTIREREKEAEAARKKKRDQWQKDPYALPELEKDIGTMTAENSARARKAKGGGRRPDVRFATEGELRSLLSSIQPTDLDLDSEFFRSLPAELQYELVGDLRAASRGTSYKRLQSMLKQSPTPIDFSRAQIAGLKTRNELTQKVLEVTDEIGDAHIKVPIRVAGARDREYVLVRNKGDQAGFVLGVREAGDTQEKAIAVDEDSASATTFDDEPERRNTEDEFDLEEVSVQDSPAKAPPKIDVPQELQNVNPNDPLARKQVARELLQRRARQLAKDKAREEGRVDEHEIMEEQLEKVRASRRSKGRSGQAARKAGAPDALFRTIADAINIESTVARIGQEDLVDESEPDIEDEDEDETDEGIQTISDDEAEDLSKALNESERDQNQQARAASVSTHDADDEVDMDEVDTNALEATDYSNFYAGGHEANQGTEQSDASWMSPKKRQTTKASTAKSPEKFRSEGAMRQERERTPEPQRAVKGSAGLGFRMMDREGYPERLDSKLLTKMRSNASDDENDASQRPIEDRTGDIVDESAEEAEMDEPEGYVDEQQLQDAVVKQEPPSTPPTRTRPDKVESSEDTPQKKSVETNRKEETLNDLPGNDVHVIDFRDEQPPSDTKQEAKTSNDQLPHAKIQPRPSERPAAKPAAEPQGSDSKTPVDEPRSPESDTIEMPPEVPQRQNGADQITIQQPESLPKADEEAMAAREEWPDVESESSEVETGRQQQDEQSRRAIEAAQNEDPKFDNIVSMEDEEGHYPRVQPENIAEEAPEPREESPYSEDWPSELEEASPSPSPERGVVLGPDGFPLPTAEELDALEAEDEADLGQIQGDQDEFVSFLSQAEGRGLREVRQEVEEEVARLRTEHAATRRTEGDVTIQMAKEIQLMLRLFGLPYITAPMEAEAQCAELVSIGLADGIITDDSDVFLFGGTFVYKNMFNNKKYVECYKLSDLNHDLGMDRSKLVQLAYLLGSDYTDGLEGVGPVLAMEILSNFAGDDGLVKFRDWWLKVQTGSDTPRDTHNTTLKRLKRTLRNKVHFDTHWPDGNVLNAYYEPTVDSSEEPFQWGLPDLDSLRSFFFEYLRWDREKTDHYLLPAIEEQNRRHRRTQATLDTSNFFDLTNGQGAAAGRVRPGYNSSRLQQVISNFRMGKAASSRTHNTGGKDQEPVALSDSEEGADDIPEQLVGKEMGLRSRPVVARPQVDSRENAQTDAVHEDGDAQAPQNGEDATREQEENGQANGKRKRGATSKRGTGAKKGRGARGGQTSTARTRAKKAGATSQQTGDERQEQEEEWRPRAPKPRRTVQRSDSGTSLRQGRSMNLDSIDQLVPPSRAALRRDRSDSSLLSTQRNTPAATPAPDVRTPIELSDDSSSLSE